MAHVNLFTSTVGDGLAKLTISILRNFESSDPFTIMLGSDSWSLSTQDAERLSAAGRRIEGRLDFASQHGEAVKLAPYYQRQLGFSDGSAAKIEIGLDEINGQACAYLEWNSKRAIDASGRLLRALSILGEATSTIRQTAASRPVQDLRINPETFRSPFGWNGQ
jgi:hypothetical protein